MTMTDRKMQSMAAPTFLDLFAGAGGLSLGLRQAGWTHLGAIEYWQDAAKTYEHNFGPGSAWCTDIANVTPGALRERGWASPEWIVGGPPCQGFSTIGKRDRTDPRNQMFLHFLRIVQQLRPAGFVLENVQGLRDMKFASAVERAFSEIGYAVSFMVLRAADYGVPQLRRRVVFVGSSSGGHFVGPAVTHRGPESWITVEDAIGDLPHLESGETATEYSQDPTTPYQFELRGASNILQGHTSSKHPDYLIEAISHIPDGGNRKSIPDHLQPRSGFHNSYSRLNSKAPAVAITSNMSKPSASRCIHPFQNRGLTAREGARLQSFPDDFHFLGGGVSQRLQIGNAVPPKLGRALGLAISDLSAWSSSSELLPLQLEA